MRSRTFARACSLAFLVLALAGCTAPQDDPVVGDAGPAGRGTAEDGPGGTVTSRQSPDGRTGHPLEGETAPDYGAVDLDGEPVRLEDHRGRPVLFHIWASWCTVCEGEKETLGALYEEYADRVTFIQVSIDSGRYEAAMREEAAASPLVQWWDPEDEVRPLFAVSYQPVTVFLAADGTVDTVWQGQLADRTTLRAEPDLARTILDRIAAT